MLIPEDHAKLEQTHLKCRRCGRNLEPGQGDLYLITILAVADPSPPVFTERDLTKDVQHEIQRLLIQLKTVDDEQAQDQVYRRSLFHLCAACYDRWIIDPTGQ